MTQISLAAIAVMCSAVCSAAPADLVEELRAAATSQGKIALGELAAFKDTYLADITIQTPRVEDDGSVAGTATFAGSNAPLLLQYVEGSSGGLGKWLVAWRLPTQNLGQLIPAVGDLAGQGVKMATPVVIFSRDRLNLSSASMSPAVRDFYREVYGGGEFSMSIQEGVNLVTSIDVQAEILVGLQALGANVNDLVLEGVLLKNFDAETFKTARAEGRLTSTIAKEAELRAKLVSGSIRGLSADFQVHDLALLVTGKPSAGVAFEMIVGNGSGQRRFDCRGQFLGAGAGSGGKSGISISAHTADESPWRNALGIQGLLLYSAALEMGSETGGSGPPRMMVGVKGDLELAAKRLSVAGGVTTRQGAPSVFLRGSIDSLSRDDLVAVANDLASAQHGRVDASVVGDVLPDFDLRQVEVLYAPAGGSEELGVPSGVGLKGELYLNDSPAAVVDALVDVSSPKPRTSIKANLSQFKIGPLTLHETDLDVLMASRAASHFRASGGCDLLGPRVAAKAELDAQRSVVAMSGKVANAFEADVMCTNSVANGSWQFSAGFKNDFSSAFESKVSDDILDWARQAERDFNKASADLEKAKRDVAKINGDIARARAQVERDRETNEAALRRAEADVTRINSDITNLRAQVQRERDVHLGAIRKAKSDVDRITRQINARRTAVKDQRIRDLSGVKSARDSAKRTYDRAQSAYQRALSAWKKAKGLDKIKKGVTKDAKGVDRDAKKVAYRAKARAYDVANAAINKVPVDADPQIVSLFAAQKVAQGALSAANAALRKIHGTAPIDSDPRVAALFGARDAALAGVRTAQDAFNAVHRVPVDADPRVASLFVARDSATAALGAAQSTVDTTGDVAQWGAKATAAAASGQLLRVESARLDGDLSAFEQEGRMELAVAVRLMNQPHNVLLAVATPELSSDNLFKLAAAQLRPGQKSSGRRVASSGPGPSASASSRRSTTRLDEFRGGRDGSDRTSTRSGSTGTPSGSTRTRTPSDSSRTPSGPPSTREGTSGDPRRWLGEVRALKRELNAVTNGASWVEYLRLSDLEQIAASQASGERRDEADQLKEALERFEKTAANPDYVSVSRRQSFGRLVQILREQTGRD